MEKADNFKLFEFSFLTSTHCVWSSLTTHWYLSLSWVSKPLQLSLVNKESLLLKISTTGVSTGVSGSSGVSWFSAGASCSAGVSGPAGVSGSSCVFGLAGVSGFSAVLILNRLVCFWACH